MRGRVELPGFLYGFYERRLLSDLSQDRIPRHIGVMVDGNRRWAKQFNAPTSQGHQAGADKIHEFLGWCQELGVKVVTLYMLSTDNMNRSSEELDLLMGIIANTLDRLDEDENISVHAMGAPELLPDYLAERLNKLTARTPSTKRSTSTWPWATAAAGKSSTPSGNSCTTPWPRVPTSTKLADELSVDDISRFLYTRGQPDPDLVIRTSGEQRLSGFLMWQSAYSEFYFCEALWPAFRKVDFLRALRDYAGPATALRHLTLPVHPEFTTPQQESPRNGCGNDWAVDLRYIHQQAKPPADRGGQYMERNIAPVVWEAGPGLLAEPPHH